LKKGRAEKAEKEKNTDVKSQLFSGAKGESALLRPRVSNKVFEKRITEKGSRGPGGDRSREKRDRSVLK